MKYIVKKTADGKFEAALMLPAGDGSFAAVAQGMSAADATVKAARIAKAAATPQAPAAARKASTFQAVAALAKNPTIANALRDGGFEAAKAAISVIPGGGVALKALELAQKFGPAKKLLSSLLKFR